MIKEVTGVRPFFLGKNSLTPSLLHSLSSRPNPPIEGRPEELERVKRFRGLLEEAVRSGKRLYGVNTGFGMLADVAIPSHQLRELQVNLVRSHAAGVGSLSDDRVVRAMMVLKLHQFYLGFSGISLGVVNLLQDLLRHDVLPTVPDQGSVGASGDLAPLAHMSLPLIGEGKVRYRSEIYQTKDVFESLRLNPVELGPKEGLSLINGTQYMTAIGSIAFAEAKHLTEAADLIAALSLEAIRGTYRAFDERIHRIRPHRGQIAVAENLRRLLAGSDPIMQSHAQCNRVQDPYSFRCIPQVHGATRDTLEHVESVLTVECNSVTDNPLIFEDGDIVSGGNFHGQPIALVLDFLAIAVAELGSIAERRVEKLTNPHMSGLPPFLTAESGLHSGFMIPHVVAAALVSENKILAHPASVDSIPTSADKEDHVSMGPIAARKCRMVNQNVANILAIELLAACQGLDFLQPLNPAPLLSKAYKGVREEIPSMGGDRSVSDEISQAASWIKSGEFAMMLRQWGVELQ